MQADPLHEPDARELGDLIKRVMRGVNGQVGRQLGCTVLYGPFVGMILPTVTPWDDGNWSTKLVGTYEHELHDAIYKAISRRPATLINVGSAEGYYAIGLARLLPNLKVTAVDLSPESRMICELYARENGIELETSEGARTPEEIRFSECKGERLYIVDVEGDELDLIDIDRCPELRNSDIIVECHDFLKSNATEIIRDRLKETHDVQVVAPRIPDLNKFPFVNQIPAVMSVLVVVEKRPMPCNWLTCWAKSKGA